tara:strand:- start:36398 stop:37609 length:1212 start_codon:yes stop_codon:yes gene_type:complete
MEEKGLKGFLNDFLSKESLFRDKKVLQASYTPETIKHREKEIKHIANILAPILKLDKPSNLFVYGKTGTGKTLTIKFISNEILKMAEQNEVPVKICYINCKLKKVADTEYRLMAQISRLFGKEIPATGLPTEEVYNIFYKILDKKKQLLVLVLDEIDQLIKKSGDEILYNLTRINSELVNAQVSIVGISNDVIFADNLDPRVKSSLSEEEIVFPPYNALQIQDILKLRATKAFKENILEQGLIEKCAAYAAREHGDARRALELLRVAGEIAERGDEKNILIAHIDKAEAKIEKDRVYDIIISQPKQSQLTLYAILEIYSQKKNFIFTGEVYELYKKLCDHVKFRPLTQRRISDIIAELDMLGIINVSVISKGRYGRTREISLAVPEAILSKIKTTLKNSLDIK